MKSMLFLIPFIAFCLQVLGQEIYELKLPTKVKSRYNTFPFDSIEIIDTRFDTTTIQTVKDGHYPRTLFKFLPTTEIAFKESLKKAIATFEKGNGTVLVNIKQLKIPNVRYMVRKGKKRPYYRAQIDNKLLFKADIYELMNNSYYSKIGSIDNEDFILTIDFTKTQLIEKIIESIEKRQLTDSLTVSYFTYTQIKNSAALEWSSLPIQTDTSLQKGMFITFEDFKNAQKINLHFELAKTIDSLYTFKLDDSVQKAKIPLPYAVFVNDTFYVHISYNTYLPLVTEARTFSFNIPSALPNMYELTSIQRIKSISNSGRSNSGNILGDLIGTAIIGAYELLDSNRKIKKIEKNQHSELFRKVYLDMYSGDFIF